MADIVPAADRLIAEIAAENAQLPADARVAGGGEMRVLGTIRHIIIEDMVMKLKS